MSILWIVDVQPYFWEAVENTGLQFEGVKNLYSIRQHLSQRWKRCATQNWSFAASL